MPLDTYALRLDAGQLFCGRLCIRGVFLRRFRWLFKYVQARVRLERALEEHMPEHLALMRRTGFALTFGLHAEIIKLRQLEEVTQNTKLVHILDRYMECWLYLRERLVLGAASFLLLVLSSAGLFVV